MARRGSSGRGTMPMLSSRLSSTSTPERNRQTSRGVNPRDALRRIVDASPSSTPGTAIFPNGGRLSRPNTSVSSRSGTPPLSTSPETTPSPAQRQDSVSMPEAGSVSREINYLREQQKKLQASSARIEEMLKQMSGKQNPASVKPTSVPRELSTHVRDVYKKIVDDEGLEWNYTARFDDDSNKDVNSSITRNVMAVTKDPQYDVTLIKRAARTYFKSRKSAHQRKLRGKHQSTSTAARRRQRKHNKAHARQKALNLSKSIDTERKEEIRAVLTADFMSSDESEVDAPSTEHQDSSSSEDAADDGADDAEQHSQQSVKKKLIRKKLPWRSHELQCIIESLDRKLVRRRSDRAKAMCPEIKVEGTSDRPAPHNAPEWAIELFS